ncbi:division/cell wall cluster transcriptional repressor MraZ [bacterium]|nr:division/cell wall cluster transcriptional repressor MraZ [bacterium]
MHDIDAIPNDDIRKPTLKRVVGSESGQVTVDKAGRICIPEDMAASAGISDQAVLVGMLDRFEIWSPERHEQVKAADRVMVQEAFRLME